MKEPELKPCPLKEVKSNNEDLNADCVCLKCYKVKCKSRSIENKYCPVKGTDNEVIFGR